MNDYELAQMDARYENLAVHVDRLNNDTQSMRRIKAIESVLRKHKVLGIHGDKFINTRMKAATKDMGYPTARFSKSRKHWTRGQWLRFLDS